MKNFLENKINQAVPLVAARGFDISYLAEYSDNSLNAFRSGHYRVTCIRMPLTLYNKAIHTYPGLFIIARLKLSGEAEGYVVVSTEGSLPPEFSVKDDGKVEKHGFWPPEDERPMGVSFQ